MVNIRIEVQTYVRKVNQDNSVPYCWKVPGRVEDIEIMDDFYNCDPDTIHASTLNKLSPADDHPQVEDKT